MNYFPNYISNKAILAYLISMLIVNTYFFSHMIPVTWLISGVVAVIAFFQFSSRVSLIWQNRNEKALLRKLFMYSLIIRLLWVFFSFYFYSYMTGKPYEFSAGDSIGYHEEAIWLKDMMLQGNIKPYLEYIKNRYSDMGYPFYLGIQYFFTDGAVLIARIIKAILSAYSVILIFNISNRNFGLATARIAAVFAMFMPNLIYYTGLHLKETEMLFLILLFVERTDNALRSNKLQILEIVVPVILASSLFLFRTVLGATALFSLATAVLIGEKQLIHGNRRFIMTIWVVLAIVVIMGGRLATEIESVWQSRSLNQEESLLWRSERDGGNAFSKFASYSIFMPLIFILPFPTIVNVFGQENQMLLNGGNFIKNIIAFFVMFAIFQIIKKKEWRKYIFVLSFLASYLIILALSAFAHSERFHVPALPFELMLAAYGIHNFSNKYKRYYIIYLVLIVIAIIGWSWFKLAGRGLA